MRLSIIVPVFNEKDTIAEIFRRIRTVDVGIEKEIIIIDDGSTDGTTQILKNISVDGVKILFRRKNIGKGCAIRRALKVVTGDIVLIQDADLEYNPGDYKRLIKPILNEKAVVVYGSRWLGTRFKGQRINLFRFGRWFVTVLSNILYNTKITDEPTGYKVFRTDIIKNLNLKCKGFEFCSEVTAKLAKKGIRIFEVPISYCARDVSEGKKMSLKDGLIAAWTLLKYRFID